MAYSSRIPVDQEYVMAIGSALYNFTYLEWIVIWTIFKLHIDGTQYDYKKLTARQIANGLKSAIIESKPQLSTGLQERLLKFYKSFDSALEQRNRLVHAHPYSTSDGTQQLINKNFKFDINSINSIALTFENIAIEGNDIFHGLLTQERP